MAVKCPIATDNFDRAKVGYNKMDIHDTIVWNEAVEAAAKLSDDNVSKSAIGFGDEIRKLKK